MSYGRTVLIFAIIASAASAVYLHRKPSVEVQGPKIENFALFDSQFGFFELWRKKHLKGVVLISHGCECPMMRKQLPYIESLRNKYEAQGIGFFYINPQDSAKDIQTEVAKYGVTIPVLYDTSQMISRNLEISRTLEAIFIDTKSWRVIYRGAINDELSFDGDRPQATSQFLATAVDEFLRGRDPRIKRTELSGGCAITYEKIQAVTYTQHVRPILQRNCIGCHITNGLPPTKLGSYDDAKRWGAMIREVIRTYRMPMATIDPNYGTAGGANMPQLERQALVNWVESGMPEGPPLPPERTPTSKRADAQRIKADLTLEFKEAVKVPPKNDFTNALYSLGEVFSESVWVEKIQFLIDDSNQVHHARLLILPAEYALVHGSGLEVKSQEAKDFALSRGRSITFNPGQVSKGPMRLPAGTAIFIPKGTQLMLDVHHANTGKWENFKPGVAFQFAQCGKTYAPLHIGMMYDKKIKIPPNTADHRILAQKTIPSEARLQTVNFHMHKRGRGMKLAMRAPNGPVVPIISVPNYRFTQQWPYQLNPAPQLPAGTKLFVEATYDNSAGNPAITDYSREIRVGLNSNHEEMLSMSYTYTVDSEPKFRPDCRQARSQY